MAPDLCTSKALTASVQATEVTTVVSNIHHDTTVQTKGRRRHLHRMGIHLLVNNLVSLRGSATPLTASHLDRPQPTPAGMGPQMGL